MEARRLGVSLEGRVHGDAGKDGTGRPMPKPVTGWIPEALGPW